MSGNIDIRRDLLKDFERNMFDSGKSEATIRSYLSDVRLFFDFLDGIALNYRKVDSENILFYKQHLFDKHEKPNSIRRKIIAIRQFYRFNSGKLSLPESPLDFTNIPAHDNIRLKPSSLSVVIDYLNHEPPTPDLKESRDSSIMTLLGLEGLKVYELIELRWSDIILGKDDSASLRIQSSRQRLITLDPTTSKLLQRYSNLWQERTHIGPDDKLILGFKGREAATILPSISRHGVKHLIYELGEELGIDHLNTETLRHCAIEYQLLKSKSCEQVMAHLGLKTIGNIQKHYHEFKKMSDS